MKELVYHRQLLPAIEHNADESAFFDGDYTATFGEHLDRVARLSAALRGLGVAPRRSLRGHGAQQPPVPRAATTPRSSARGVINPLNLRLAPKELEYILADSGTKVCFVDAFFAPRHRQGARRRSASSTSC